MRLGILGYGNLGKALAKEIKNTPHELVAVFSRRRVYESGVNILPRESISDYYGMIDVMLIATKSNTEVEADTMNLLPHFNTIDSFDMHQKIPEYKAKVDTISKSNSRISIISAGWDPGILSIVRAIAKISVGAENINTFWGIGKSLGHTTALMSIEGVKQGVQYTVPIPESKALAKNQDANLSDTARHRRECFIVPKAFANKKEIEEKIRNMDGYFKGYETAIHFISESDFLLNHNRDFHRGEVISTSIKKGEKTAIDMKIKISSNSEFTAKIMISYLNAINCLQNIKKYGSYTPVDIPLSLLIDDETYTKII